LQERSKASALTIAEITLAGVTIPANARLIVLMRSANRGRAGAPEP
jgi:hypothetical protein